MKIGIVSNLYPPISRGGAEQIAHRVAHELHVLGHDVFVVSTQREWSLVPHITESNVERIYRYRPYNLYHPLDDHRYAFPVRIAWHLIDMYGGHAARALGTVLDEERPDVVITHNLKGFGMQAVSAIRDRRIRHIHTLHDVQLAIPSGLLIYGQERNWLNASFAQRWYESSMKRIVGSPDVVVSPSKFLADFYASRGFFPESRRVVLPNPAPNIQAPQRSSRCSGPVRILFAGQLEEHKGIKFLLETLNRGAMPFELHVAGEGTLTSYVEEWARRDARVIYHGFCSLGNLVKLFSISDAVVVPSLCYENSPTVIYESFQAGVPVVAANIGGVGELVRDKQNGYLFAPGDGGALLAALRRLTSDEDKFWSRSSEIRASALDHSLAAYVAKLEELMRP
jgi:glycosyltransferase involved in cell wall biosynthesis